MELLLLAERYAICRIPSSSPVPSWFKARNGLASITYTSDECSIVCPEMMLEGVQDRHEAQLEVGWRTIKVFDQLDFSLTGILASLAVPLANAGIPIFALSTFETDYILVKEIFITQTQEALEQHGHTFIKE